MISRTVDYITAEHPSAAEYGKERIELIFGTTDSRNITVFVLAGLASAMLAMCGIPVVAYTALVITVVVRAQTAVLAGFMKQWLYIIAAAAYFMLPYVFVLMPGTAEEAQATDLQNMLSELMKAVPLGTVRLLTGGEISQLVSGALLAVYLILFAVGVRLRDTAKRSDFYCRTRLDQLK